MTATEDDATSTERVVASAEGTALENIRRVRKAVFGAAFGFGVDAFDIYVPTVALLPAMNYFAPANMPTNTKAVVSARNRGNGCPRRGFAIPFAMSYWAVPDGISRRSSC